MGIVKFVSQVAAKVFTTKLLNLPRMFTMMSYAPGVLFGAHLSMTTVNSHINSKNWHFKLIEITKPFMNVHHNELLCILVFVCSTSQYVRSYSILEKMDILKFVLCVAPKMYVMEL